MGVFDLDETFQKLKGGWWLSTEKIDPDLSFGQLCNMKGFNLWEFNKDEIAREAVRFLYDELSVSSRSIAHLLLPIYNSYKNSLSTDAAIREEQRDERKKLEILISKHKRRLQKLKEQEALQGISVDPKIPLEIEDIETKILKLQERLKNEFGKE